jgi:hypothetical protein
MAPSPTNAHLTTAIFMYAELLQNPYSVELVISNLFGENLEDIKVVTKCGDW